MARILFIIVEACAADVFLFPLMCLLNQIRFYNWRLSTAYGLFSLYLCCVWSLTGLPNITYIRFGLNVNLIPFLGILNDLKNSLLNILLFLPLGFLLPALWTSFSVFKKTLFSGIGLSAAIELLQLLTYRASDVNDLITNTLGTVIGWGFAKLIWGRPLPLLKQNSVIDLPILLVCVFSVMFFAQPFLSNALWGILL